MLSGMQAMRKVSDVIAEVSDRTGNFESIRRAMMQHPSDMVRNYAAYLTGKMNWPDVSVALEAVRVFAADKNAGTREIAFYVIRHRIINDTIGAIEFLKNWVADNDANIRRFAVESTRPRGVWVSHIPVLKENPEPGFPLLRALIKDDSRYVQNSVANWMNDASKNHPERVAQECMDWIRHSGDNKATAYIVRRALRTVTKR
jgi:3-methyladenine DNA glycosylase AlkC